MAARIITPDGRELIGYTDRWSAAPGEHIALMASSYAPTVAVQLVRLQHGDPRTGGPGLRTERVSSEVNGEYSCSQHEVRAGSFATLENAGPPASCLSIWAWSTWPARGRRQVLLTRGGLELSLDSGGRPTLRSGDLLISSQQALMPETWTKLTASVSENSVSLLVGDQTATCVSTDIDPPGGPVTIAASPQRTHHFNGRLQELYLDSRAYDVRELRLTNAPMLAVSGRQWDDDTTDFRSAPDQYAAVHFHEDDLEDAEWPAILDFVIPDSLPSGVYAFRLAADELTDHVPFVVTPPAGTATARIGLLLPTLTYLAYSNERQITTDRRGMVAAGDEVRLDEADTWLAAHPGAGLSAYDRHSEGTGCCLVSMRRPIPNFRPDFIWWYTDSPERLGADLYITDFLEHRGEQWDVFTDHDLHQQGVALLRRYPVILTGTHPEYWTRDMLAAMRQYLENGGRLIYLGGNGFYWVTSIDPERPHLAEIRRGMNGTRSWTSRPGELRHQTTGEQGGLWRYRAHTPNSLVGVGFTAQSDTHDTAPGYKRTEASFDPKYQWIFDGISNADIIGDYGHYLGGSAGYEIDRHDVALGSPSHSVVLMTSQGLHSDSYRYVVEDIESMIASVDGSSNPGVRSDVVYLPYAGGGAVFSVGSCSWCGSLSFNSYDNDIYRITNNVLSGFLRNGDAEQSSRP